MADVQHALIGRGFDDPVLGSQRCFRAILSAMSEPGTIHLMNETIEAPAEVPPAAALLLLTLADQETPVWLAPRFTASVAPFVRFHCGAPVVEAPSAARFALLDGRFAEPALDVFDPGEDRYPDRSATILVACDALDGGTPVALSGPGIETTRPVAPSGLRSGFWHEVAANNARYPLGVDLLLTSSNAILAVPRSCRITLEGESA
jgi:alpha-D-ribose 1-methylphosphonate 5-triphosphate synthase subunit PhnH